MNKLLKVRNHRGLRRYLQSSSHSPHTSVHYAATPIHPDELTVQVFGSSTEVGKTIISAGLAIAALQDHRKVCYLKPVQTGELDEYFIQLYTNPRGTNDIFVRTLQHWSSNMSPHLAAMQDEHEGEVRIVYT
jgi:dethiobiotin synthetase